MRRIIFFALKGGCGRTTLAVEVGCLLAARGASPNRGGRLRVALLDISGGDAAVRLGLEPSNQTAMQHDSGLHLISSGPQGSGDAERLNVTLRQLEDCGTDVVLIDVSPSTDALTTAALQHADDIAIVVVPTPSAVYAAYQAAATLRRLGLGERVRLVINQAHPQEDLGEMVTDLQRRVLATIPTDRAIVDAERAHRSVAIDHVGSGDVTATALSELAEALVPGALSSPPVLRAADTPPGTLILSSGVG